jgi:hypothetical protein
LAPLACKTYRIDARVLAVLSERELVPEIWLPDRAGAGALADASGQAPLDAQAPHPRDADHLRAPCPVSDLLGIGGLTIFRRQESVDLATGEHEGWDSNAVRVFARVAMEDADPPRDACGHELPRFHLKRRVSQGGYVGTAGGAWAGAPVFPRRGRAGTFSAP